MSNLSCSFSADNDGKLHNCPILLSMSSVGAAAIVVCLIALIMALKFKLHKFFIHRLAIYQVLSATLYSIVCVVEVIFINYRYDDDSRYDNDSYHIPCIIEDKATVYILLDFSSVLSLSSLCSVCSVGSVLCSSICFWTFAVHLDTIC